MQARAPVGSPECTFFLPISTFGRPESAVACMGALLVCPISIQEWFRGVWGQKNVQKALDLLSQRPLWQNWTPYGSKCCSRLSMGSSFQKWRCGLHQMQVLAPQGTETPPPATHPGEDTNGTTTTTEQQQQRHETAAATGTPLRLVCRDRVCRRVPPLLRYRSQSTIYLTPGICRYE